MRDDKPRKVLFVDRRFQADFILKFLLLLLVGTGIFVLAAYLVLNKRFEETYYSAHMAIRSTGEVLLPTLLALSAVFIVVLGAAAAVITLYVSHHIAGPLYAIRRYLENISRGELDFQARLRLGDQTTPLAASLAEAVESLNAKLVAIRSRADAVNEVSQRLSRHVSAASGATDECRADLTELLEREADLSRETAFFHLRGPSGHR